METLTPDLILDCYGLLCPVPVKKTARALDGLQAGQILQVIATDEWFGPDLEAWLRFQPHQLLSLESVGQEIHATLKKQ
ncbi:MAG: sulfurtransferase TusA family protein [Candidatus Omnitrophica bacterium]|nr:sulfurtransferase TusA family protein [Candidatus Omnitrophota bacterium]